MSSGRVDVVDLGHQQHVRGDAEREGERNQVVNVNAPAALLRFGDPGISDGVADCGEAL
jgi:hypothetical protein